MKLVFDYGNTLVKVALFDGDSMVALKAFKSITAEQIETFISNNRLGISKKDKVDYCIVSSVRNLPGKIRSYINSQFNTIELSFITPTPITIKYLTPETLGNDRIALSVAASAYFHSKDVLVIDAGTCITYDFVNKNREYIGGAISPGINMRYKALKTFTDKLPIIENLNNADLIGNSTENSLRSGVMNGTLAEVDGIIDQYKRNYPDLEIIITGGDLKYFDKNLKNNIFANSNLVLEGLNMILKYNVEE